MRATNGRPGRPFSFGKRKRVRGNSLTTLHRTGISIQDLVYIH